MEVIFKVSQTYMKIISWNVGRNFTKINKQVSILDEQPDILCLQEVTQKSFKIYNQMFENIY